MGGETWRKKTKTKSQKRRFKEENKKRDAKREDAENTKGNADVFPRGKRIARARLARPGTGRGTFAEAGDRQTRSRWRGMRGGDLPREKKRETARSDEKETAGFSRER